MFLLIVWFQDLVEAVNARVTELQCKLDESRNEIERLKEYFFAAAQNILHWRSEKFLGRMLPKNWWNKLWDITTINKIQVKFRSETILKSSARMCSELRDRLRFVADSQPTDIAKEFDSIAVFDKGDNRATVISDIIMVRCRNFF